MIHEIEKESERTSMKSLRNGSKLVLKRILI